MHSEQAHNDIVQFPVGGGHGYGLILLAGGSWLLQLPRSFFWVNALSVYLVGGLLSLFVYAWWDFPLHCPANLIMRCALWPAIKLWIHFDEQSAKG